MRALRLSSLLLVLALAGCATTVSVPTPQQQARGQQARQLFDAGQYTQAAQAWQNLAAQDRQSADYFRLRAAEAWREAGSMADMKSLLGRIDRSRLQPNDARHYDLLEAEVALAQGNNAGALQLTGAPVDNLPDTLQRRALELRARALAANQQPWQAAQARVKLDPLLSGTDRGENARKILQLLDGMDADTLQQHATNLPTDAPMQHWLAQALGRKGVQVARAAPDLTQPVGTLMPGGNQAEGYDMPQQVALLLPLSGPLAAAGNAIRQGFFASYFQGAHADASLPPVKVYDSAGTVQGALSGYRKAVADGAALVVGPLTRDGVQAVLGQASLPAAVLALNHPDGNALPPPHATEFALRPEAEGIQVARRMLRSGLTRAIVLSSGEGFAQRAAKAFETQFEGRGGQIATELTLNPGEVDYAAQIHSLDVSGPSNTGIFISMRPEQARLLMPQLRLAKVNLPVFATSHVYDGEDNPVADGDLDGVRFCDAPWLFNAQPGLPPRAAVANLLSSARGTSARLFAFGMDAWSLTPYLSWLRSHTDSYLPGATGRLSEDDFGRVHRTLIWARFDNGLAHPLEGNLEMGAPTQQPAPASSTSAQPVSAPATPATAPPPAPAGSLTDNGY